MRVARAAFGVSYDGSALATGRMEVRDLAPALLALGDLFADAGRLLYPDQPPVALTIEATGDGSFLVNLALVSDAWGQIIDIFGSSTATALDNLKDLIIGVGGLYVVVKQIKNRRFTTQQAGPGHIRLLLDDGTALEIPSDVWRLYERVEIRRKALEVIKPLKREGIDLLKFSDGPRITVTVETSDVPAYQLPDVSEAVLLDDVREQLVEIVSVTFTEGNKWRFSDGQQVFYAAMEDPEFLNRIESRAEAFRKGDVLRCRMRIIQTRRSDGLHTEYFLTDVLEHIPPPTQMSLEDGEP